MNKTTLKICKTHNNSHILFNGIGYFHKFIINGDYYNIGISKVGLGLNHNAIRKAHRATEISYIELEPKYIKYLYIYSKEHDPQELFIIKRNPITNYYTLHYNDSYKFMNKSKKLLFLKNIKYEIKFGITREIMIINVHESKLHDVAECICLAHNKTYTIHTVKYYK